MIIVNQDKGTIINVKNIEAIGIGHPLNDEDGKFKILANTISDNQYTIAKYKTEERAKEVLKEISDSIKSWEDLKVGQPSGIPCFKYCMPED